jgi:hypothetical protein
MPLGGFTVPSKTEGDQRSSAMVSLHILPFSLPAMS